MFEFSRCLKLAAYWNIVGLISIFRLVASTPFDDKRSEQRSHGFYILLFFPARMASTGVTRINPM
jgi:hypothetical protein